MDLDAICSEYSTPFYLYDFDAIQERFMRLKAAFKARKSLIFYAVKANSNLSLLRMLCKLGSGFDCVSFNEIKRALLAGANPYKIIFSGVGKSQDELQSALLADILYINVESFDELLALEQIAAKCDKKARISIRVNPNVDAKTHPYISTGLDENKFGVDLNLAKKMYLHAHKSAHLEPIGVHFHIGSNLHDLQPIFDSAKIVWDFVNQLKAANIDLRFFDIGGGLGVGYESRYEADLYQYAQGVLGVLGADMTICLEPGRYLVANAGYLITSVLYQKSNKNKNFYIVDASMSELIRPSLYSAYHHIKVLKNAKLDAFDSADEISLDSATSEISLDDKKCQTSASNERLVLHEPCSQAKPVAKSLNGSLPREDSNAGALPTSEISLDECSDEIVVDIVGGVCESGDFLAKNISLQRVSNGDRLVVYGAGAYGYSMSSNYNSRTKIAEYAKCGGKIVMINKPQSFEQMIQTELECLNG